MDNRPIGIFDSGIGGLTVLKEYVRRMPQENYIYYADTKHLPYGNKTQEEILSYVQEIISYFLSKNVKAIVMACGTASSLAYPLLKKHCSVPLFDIITPTAQLIQATNIGVLATQGSIQSGQWEKSLRQFHQKINVYSHACPRWVPLLENNQQDTWHGHWIVHQDVKSFQKLSLDAVILRMYTLSFTGFTNSKRIGNYCRAYQYRNCFCPNVSKLPTRK